MYPSASVVNTPSVVLPIEIATGSLASSSCDICANGVVVAGLNPSMTRKTRPRTGRRAVVPIVLLMSA